uniref:Uncharacterized protein n=1 Tax=Oryza sativa subsp. japonica TaxID=39947 RepID=Q654T1_ORYSJ|nr:hypothetical protein [Oryza sativa Japonica Group]
MEGSVDEPASNCGSGGSTDEAEVFPGREGDLREVLHLLTTRLVAGLDPPMEHYGWVLDLVVARRAV